MEFNILSQLILIITSIIWARLLLLVLGHQLLSFHLDAVKNFKLWHGLDNETDIFLETQTDL